MLTVDLKITLDTIQRRFSLPVPCPTWEDLAALVKDGFGLPGQFKLGLCYQDEDGEYITISSPKELAGVWPTLTSDDERDLDTIPPLRFSIVNIPSHPASVDFTGPPPHHHHGHRGRHTRFGGDWTGHHTDGPGTLDGPKPPKDGPKPPKDGNKDSLKDDVHKFIEAVKTNVTENKDVQEAYKKVLEHTRNEHGPKKPDGPAFGVFGQIASQSESSDALTSGIVAAILTPAFLGPPSPPPHFGGPPHGGLPYHGPHPGGGRPHHGPPPHHEPHHDGPHECSPPPPPPPGLGRGPHHRGPGGPPPGPGGPYDEHRGYPRGPFPPPHGRGHFGPGAGRPHGRPHGPFGGRRGGPEHHSRWGFGSPGRGFRRHPYYGNAKGFYQEVDKDAETVASLDSEFEFDSDIEDITQGVREMHRNRGAF